MGHVDLDILFRINIAVLVLGILCLAGCVTWLARSGQWRAPLAIVPPPIGGPTILHALLIIFGFQITLILAVTVFRSFALGPSHEKISAGSSPWHIAMLIGSGMHVAFAILAAWILRERRSFATEPRTKLGIPAVAGVAFVISFAVVPIAAAQLNLGRYLWSVANPDESPPMHEVLTALQNSAWGGWGAFWLAVGATLTAPIYEELAYRGVLLQALWRGFGSAWPAIIVSSVLFGFVHSQPQDVLPLITFAIVLGYLRLRTRSLLVCILAHVLFNARTMMFTLLNPEVLTAGF